MKTTIGLMTATVLAATIALVQRDIKKVLDSEPWF